MIDRMPVAVRRWLLLAGAVVVGVVGWLDWVQIGERRRSSYAMFRSLQTLGLDGLDPVRVLWWWVPVLSVATVLLTVAGRPRWALAPAAVAGLVVGVAAAVVIWSGLAGGLGPFAALGGVFVLVLGLVTNVQVRS